MKILRMFCLLGIVVVGIGCESEGEVSIAGIYEAGPTIAGSKMVHTRSRNGEVLVVRDIIARDDAVLRLELHADGTTGGVLDRGGFSLSGAPNPPKDLAGRWRQVDDEVVLEIDALVLGDFDSWRVDGRRLVGNNVDDDFPDGTVFVFEYILVRQ